MSLAICCVADTTAARRGGRRQRSSSDPGRRGENKRSKAAKCVLPAQKKKPTTKTFKKITKISAAKAKSDIGRSCCAFICSIIEVGVIYFVRPACGIVMFGYWVMACH